LDSSRTVVVSPTLRRARLSPYSSASFALYLSKKASNC